MLPSLQGDFQLPSHLELDQLVYNVELLETWRSKDLITCSAIWFLDEERRRISPLYVKSDQISDLNMLNNISNRELIKKSRENLFSYPISNLESNIVISFFFDPSCEPRYCRIWNSLYDDSSSLRRFKISLGDSPIITWEVPLKYGTEVSLVHNTPLSLKTKQTLSQIFVEQQRKHPIHDSLGALPIRRVHSISFKFLRNYGDKDMFGFNGMEILDENGTPFTSHDIEEIFFENTIDFTNPTSIIQKDSITGTFSDPFLMQVSDPYQQPKMLIKLKKSKYVSGIEFYNLVIPGHNDIGIKLATVSLDNEQYWVGRFPKSSSKHIYLADSHSKEENSNSILCE
ncbi:hypothetical protein TVAG_407600 [Trichomonas vaginalis G3]|uniref:KATNIP domain-containing protein n=1 Tax=Trichomonas vaginalis (strain ATCC PRA-98 / G3) TaxID=412133 RepID=A2F1A2_TRIV3|nr:hypothetical protein TVAGG3_0665590 [Trichomonas vaginalis G3]EAY01331.1 hypothetical protein TVAG_407600 [Trichomonas vaginalis G3]KAI5506810.1 hypothetical protein TVAGG3_0665590 [Trichomonas vaginalis G3]|eukprot:XP_001330189.1 hypothetical protein [Trichomonas vaginalis G3]